MRIRAGLSQAPPTHATRPASRANTAQPHGRRERTGKPKPVFTPFVQQGKCLGPATSQSDTV